MNQRIKQLMTKCNYIVDGTCDTSREEKFAELIIEECCDYVRAIDAMEIKKHFGVEE